MTDDATGPPEGRVLLLATDGSDLATTALVAGLQLVGHAGNAVLMTVVPAADPSLFVGAGHAGPVMTPSETADLMAARSEQAQEILDATSAALSQSSPQLAVRSEVRAGDPGEEICRAALEHAAAGIILGTRGQGGFKRALLGSVSDHVVRNAPCPVVTVNPT